MIIQQAQIKLNLPLLLKDYIESKAQRFGMPVAGYVKHLILKDIEDMKYPEFTASEKVEKAYEKALKDKKEGKLIQVDSLDKLFG